MGKNQWIKFSNWVFFVPLLPLVVYPAALVVAGLMNEVITLKQTLELGDLLFLVIVMLAGTIDTTLQGLMLDPSPTNPAPIRIGIVDYISFLFGMGSLIIYAIIYGLIVLSRIDGKAIPNLNATAALYVASYIGFTIFCGYRYYRLLRLEIL